MKKVFALYLILASQLGWANLIDPGWLVIVSNVDSMPVGSGFDHNVKVSLADGQTLSVIHRTGKTVTLKGPLDWLAVDVGLQPQLQGDLTKKELEIALNRIVSEPKDDASSLGTVRSVQKIEPTSLNQLRLTDRRQCVLVDRPVSFVRPAEKDKTLRIISRTGEVAQLNWNVNQNELLWPQQLALKPGEMEFVIRQEQLIVPRKLTIYGLPKGFSEFHSDFKKIYLSSRGC